MKDLRVSSVSTCWQGPLKILFEGPHQINQGPHLKRVAQVSRSKGPQWYKKRRGIELFFFFFCFFFFCFALYIKTTEICFWVKAYPKWKFYATKGPHCKLLLTGPFSLNLPVLHGIRNKYKRSINRKLWVNWVTSLTNWLTFKTLIESLYPWGDSLWLKWVKWLT